MKKQIKKGFTLVELLVVIAILAVLATVSVVGYTSFITKANNSNALTELKQAEEVVLAELIDTTGASGSDTSVKLEAGTLEFSYNSTNGKIDIDGSAEGDITPKFRQKFVDCAQLKGFFVGGDKKIYYVTENKKGIATWVSGSLPEAGGPSDILEGAKNYKHPEGE